MRRALVALILTPFLVGCSTPIRQSGHNASDAIRCAQNWRRQGFDFDPNSMSCSDMWERVQAIRRAAYWREIGYIVDPNSRTWEQVDQKVQDIDRARYWKEKGYDLDPNTMTAQEMDRHVRQLEQTQLWNSLGYYYDPVSQNVYLSADKKTPLASLSSPGAGGWRPDYSISSWPYSGSTYSYSTSSYPYSITAPGVAGNGTYYGQISESTGRAKTVYVRGYYRRDGTYVRSHYRSR